ncbi:MAG: GldG family protein [Vicinamibacteraceae bacterium]
MLKTILNWVGWVGVALVLAAIALLILKPDLTTVRWWLAMAGLVCVLLYMVSQWREIIGAFGNRAVRYGSLSIGSIAIVIGILVGVNYVAGRESKRWDLTASKQFSLSDQTKSVLADLESPVQIKVFAREGGTGEFRDRLLEYQNASDRVKVEYIDPDQQRTVAQKYKIQQYGTIIAEYAGRSERTTTNSEQEVTGAIVRAVEGGQKKVYFVQGHGERDPTSADERGGYNAAAEQLKTENFQVEPLQLAQQRDIPDDADVVVVAGPQTDLLQPEAEALRRYLNRGGKLLLMIDPPTREGSQTLTNLVGLAREWGIEVGTNVVVDASGMGQLIGSGPETPLAMSYPGHAITNNFKMMTAFPLARSIAPVSGGVDGRTAQAVVETSKSSWAEVNLAGLATGGEVSLDEKAGDKPGPITLAAAVSVTAPEPPATASGNGDAAKKEAAKAEAAKKQAASDSTKAPETRVVVVGDSDFASNSVLGLQGNRDLFLNTLNWLAEQESLIDIRPQEPDDRRVTMTAAQTSRVVWLSMLVVPALVFMSGVYTWWRRRG